MDDLTFKVDEDGILKEYVVIKYVKNPKNDNMYVIYHEKNDDKDVFASLYRIEKGELILDEIKTDEEWDYLDEILNDEEDNHE